MHIRHSMSPDASFTSRDTSVIATAATTTTSGTHPQVENEWEGKKTKEGEEQCEEMTFAGLQWS